MCHVSDEAKASLQQWATLEKKLAPLLKRVKQYQDAQKLIEDQVKAELTQYESGSVETDSVTVTFNTRAGQVNWSALAKDLGIAKDVQDAHRKAPTRAFSFKATEKSEAATEEESETTQPKERKPRKPRAKKADAQSEAEMPKTETETPPLSEEVGEEREDTTSTPPPPPGQQTLSGVHW